MSSIEFEKFRRNWSEKNSAQRFPMGRVNSASRFYWRSTGREPILAMKFASCDDDP
ncbi:hypothetical protein LEP1GSC021_4072 [Leptospira noguchii str. 1993005606]|nr:hypothetical protein LEP1GSC021_4072 [Leptospira noguchii str. 1993005606]